MPTNPTDVVNPGFTVNAITPIVLTLDPSRGENGEPGEPGQGINWRGEWATGIAYNAYDAVSRNGGSYLAEVNNNSVDPATDNGSVWGIIATPGIPGPPGPTGLTNRGNWNATTQYNINDLVSRSGSSYLAIAPNINIDPSLGDATHWQMFASAGTGTGDMVKAIYDTNNDGIVDKAALATAIPWSGITGVPSVFPASPHAPTHNLGGSDQVSPDWTQVQNKPTTFPPSLHAPTHLGGSDPIAPAGTTTAGLLAQVSGLTTDYVRGDNTCQNLGLGVQPTIWSARLRSFNAVGNPNFECDQISCHASVVAPAKLLDRWQFSKSGTMNFSASSGPEVVLLPGTNFQISAYRTRTQLSTQQASLGATDYLIFRQYIEGPMFRELASDVHSVSLLVRSSVAGLKFGLILRDSPTTTKTLAKLCTIPAANTWTLIQLPNLPVWPSGNFTTVAGSVGYELDICLAGGSTYLAPSNDTWLSGNYFGGAAGQSNFAASPVNSTFDVAFVQHEPGSVCSTLMDKPFSQNFDECQRYYSKSYPYNILPGAVNSAGAASILAAVGQNIYGTVSFPKRMANIPGVQVYSDVTGAAGGVRDLFAGADRGISAPYHIGETCFGGVQLVSVNSASTVYTFQWWADTNW
jgi:hypothetical protein